jgi:hypothetical protein
MPRPPQQLQNNINLNTMAKINVTAAPGGGGGGSGTVTSVGVTSSTLTVTGSPVTTSGTIVANIPDGFLKVGTGVTGTLQNVVDTNGTATQLFLSSTGIQATSKIQITTADTNYIDAEDNSGNNRFTVGRDPSSQLVTVDFASVPTALTTPVGAIRTATDGVNLANVQTFLENGNIGLGTDTPGSKLDVHSTGAIVAQFNKTVSGNSYIQQLMAGTARWKQGFTTATGAYDIIDDVNALTRLSVLNTGQLKLNAYTSTSAFTGTTAGFLAFDASGNILSVTSPATSPAGTTGAVQFNNAGAFGADSTNLFWDNTNKRLGIGTATPTGTLQVKGSGSTSATTSLLVQNSAGSELAKVRDDGSVFYTSGYFNIQTSAVAAPSSGAQLNFNISGNGPGMTITNQNGTTYRIGQYNAGNVLSIGDAGASTPVFNINTSGNIGVGTTAPNASAILDVTSTTKGFLPPRMTNAQRLLITTPAVGLMVYCTDAVEGLYVYKSTGWTFVI